MTAATACVMTARGAVTVAIMRPSVLSRSCADPSGHGKSSDLWTASQTRSAGARGGHCCGRRTATRSNGNAIPVRQCRSGCASNRCRPSSKTAPQGGGGTCACTCDCGDAQQPLIRPPQRMPGQWSAAGGRGVLQRHRAFVIIVQNLVATVRMQCVASLPPCCASWWLLCCIGQRERGEKKSSFAWIRTRNLWVMGPLR